LSKNKVVFRSINANSKTELMTKAEKDFIQAYIHIPWAVQQLCLVEDPNAAESSSFESTFRSIEEALEFADIPFFISINDDLAFAFLPLNSPFLLNDLNELLSGQLGSYIAAITLPGVNIKRMGNIQPDILLHSSMNEFRNMVSNIQTYISFQLKPKFSQSILDSILDELSNKSFEELSPLKQLQLRHFSAQLPESSKTNPSL